MSQSLKRRQQDESKPEMEALPLVSVVVLSYNSEKYIQEALDSICSQTYPKLELVLADDCSSDNTINIIKKFIKNTSDRFTAIKLIESPTNTGTSANCNRGEKACSGDWVKVLAADDVLISDSIQHYVDYVLKHPEANYIFSKVTIFGSNPEFKDYFDYSFFSKTKDQQLDQLIFQGNCIPAPSAFYKRQYVNQLGIINDEKIPLIEDLPKWINLLDKGVSFSFINKVLVKYRTGGGTTKSLLSRELFHSNRLLTFLYLFPEWEKMGYEYAINRIIKEEIEIYGNLLTLDLQIRNIRKSYAYRIGKMILKPFSLMKVLLNKTLVSKKNS